MNTTETTEKTPTQCTTQIFQIASELNRKLDQTLVENPELVLSAAVLAFEKLETRTQLDMIREARTQLDMIREARIAHADSYKD